MMDNDELMKGFLQAVCNALEAAGHHDVSCAWGQAGVTSYHVEVFASGEKATYLVDPTVPTFIRVVDMEQGFGF